MRNNSAATALLTVCLFFIRCQELNRPLPLLHIVPGKYVYSIVEHNDSLYFSTQRGEVFSFSPCFPDSLRRLGFKQFHPLRTLAFKRSGKLFASSYDIGVHEVHPNTLLPVTHIGRAAWAMRCDDNNTVWLAGRQGVFREQGDTLLRFSDLHEAYDVDFYQDYLIVAHRNGVTFYDTVTAMADTTFCRGTICWSLDVFDTLLVVGGVEKCILISNRHATVLPLKPQYTIPWSATRDSSGTIFLGTQKGLYEISKHTLKPRCIAFKGKCIKSVLVDSKNRLWAGTYFSD